MVFFLGAVANAETIRIAGTGSSAPLMERLFGEFNAGKGDVTLTQVKPPLGSGGALRALGRGRVELAIASRPPNQDEAKLVGSHFPLAATAFVIASSSMTRPRGMSLGELADIYAGRTTQWDDGSPIRLVLRSSAESDTAVLKSLSPDMSLAVDLAAKRAGMALGQDDFDTAALLVNARGSLGPTTQGLISTLGLALRALPLNGISPTFQNLQSGVYPWRKVLYVVLPLKPSKPVQEFANFLKSDEAAMVLRRYEYLPLTQ